LSASARADASSGFSARFPKKNVSVGRSFFSAARSERSQPSTWRARARCCTSLGSSRVYLGAGSVSSRYSTMASDSLRKNQSISMLGTRAVSDCSA
jgi:hypothetical protein